MHTQGPSTPIANGIEVCLFKYDSAIRIVLLTALIIQQPMIGGFCKFTVTVLFLQTQACLAGDSAAYERRASHLDDVVIISALRTPMCKVQTIIAVLNGTFGWLPGVGQGGLPHIYLR